MKKTNLTKRESRRTFTTYGFRVDLEKIKPVRNSLSETNKPKGGLWCSPKGSRASWRKLWIISKDGYRGKIVRTGSRFQISPEAKILKIDSPKKYEKILEEYGKTTKKTMWGDDGELRTRDYFVMNFEKIKADGWDGIWLKTKGLKSLATSTNLHYKEIVKWGCESLMIMNPKVIQNLTHF